MDFNRYIVGTKISQSDKTQMKLLFHLPCYPAIGGIQTVTDIVVQELIERGYEVHIISHFEQTSAKSTKKADGVKTFLMPDPRLHDSSQNRDYMLSVIRENKYDFIVFQDSYAPVEKTVIESAKSANVPLIVLEHSSPDFIRNKRCLQPVYTLKGFLRQVLHPYLLHRDIRRRNYIFRNCYRYVVLSRPHIDEFSSLTRIRPDHPKFCVIPNPIYIKEPRPLAKPAKRNQILFVGRLVKEKRVDCLLKIWKITQPSLPEWEFIIVGDGPERKRLHYLSDRLGLSNIRFEGFKNPSKYYQESKILLLCSKMEGWGMVLVEAMQYGCVPVSLDSFSSLRDIIDNNKNGIVIDKKNSPEEWRNALITLAADDGQLTQMSEKAREKAGSFDIKRVITHWEKLFDNEITVNR